VKRHGLPIDGLLTRKILVIPAFAGMTSQIDRIPL